MSAVNRICREQLEVLCTHTHIHTRLYCDKAAQHTGFIALVLELSCHLLYFINQLLVKDVMEKNVEHLFHCEVLEHSVWLCGIGKSETILDVMTRKSVIFKF